MASEILFGNGPNSFYAFSKSLFIKRCNFFGLSASSLVLICVVNPVDVMLWKGWQSRELVWECKATQDFPTIIASTILLSLSLSYYHCPNYLTILLSLLLYIYGHHSKPSKRLCISTETLANKIQRIMALVTDISPMFLSSLPIVKSIFHWAVSHRSSQMNSSQWHSNAIFKIC